MESLTKLSPAGWKFDMQVPVRLSEWYSNGYEKFTASIFAQFCKSSDLIIDIGAHFGFFTLIAAEVNDSAKIIAIEASPENFQILTSNTNGIPNLIQLRNSAFSNSIQPLDFKITEDSDNCHVVNSPGPATIKIETVTAAQLKIDSKKNILIKIDIEGFELEALESLSQTILECENIKLIIEFNPSFLRKKGRSNKELFYKLRNLGFRIFAICDSEYRWKEMNKNSFEDLSLINSMGYVNLVCVKRSITKSICGILHSSALGGGERNYLELAAELISEGFIVNSILPLPDKGLGKELTKIGSSVSYVAEINWWAKEAPGRFLNLDADYWSEYVSPETTRIIRGLNPDLTLSSSIVCAQGAISSAVLNKPHVWWIQEFADIDHGLNFPAGRYKIGKIVEEFSDLILCVSESVKNHFYTEKPAKARVVYPKPKFNLATKSLKNEANPFVIGVVASFQKGKGHIDALQAMANLVTTGLHLKMIFFGSGKDVDTKRILDCIDDLELSENVTMAGFLSNRDEIYDQIDCILVASKNEAFGRVPFEATHYGIPVVYTDLAGPKEYMIPNVTGIPYIPGDIDSLCRALASLESNRKLRANLAENAKLHFKSFNGGNPFGKVISKLFNEIEFLQKDEKFISRIRLAHAIAERNSIRQSKAWKLYALYRWLQQKL